MPENHQLFTWNGERFKRWAAEIGPHTYQVIESLLNRYKVEEQAYKGCLSLLKLSDKYTATRLEMHVHWPSLMSPSPVIKILD